MSQTAGVTVQAQHAAWMSFSGLRKLAIQPKDNVSVAKESKPSILKASLLGWKQ